MNTTLSRLCPLLLSLLLAAPALAACPTAPVAESSATAQQSVDELIRSGRERLDAGEPERAQALFEKASELDGGSFRTQVWLLRSWMDQWRSNETLDAIDALDRAGHEGPEMAYLYGMAFARRSQGNIAAGVTDNSIQMNFQDAIGFLETALAADADRFHDAYRPLALAHWYNLNLAAARAASEQDVARHPKAGEGFLLLGRVAMSQFVDAQQNELAEEAKEHWAAGRKAFEDAIQALGRPRELLRRSQLAQAHTQLGNALLWRAQDEGATEEERAAAKGTALAAYTAACGWDPQAVDLGRLFGTFDADEFLGMVDTGAAAFAKHFGAKDARDATLQWWLGYANYRLRKPADSEKAFAKAVEKWPDYANAWLYISLCRYDLKKFAGSLEALRQGWDTAPEAIVQTVLGERDRAVPILEYLVGWCVGEERLADAAFVSEVCAESVQDEPRFWNNTGLFLRDEGERIRRTERKPDPEALQDLFERSFEAYRRALDLAPDDPALLNDTAVMLHYYLVTDLELARTMYERARVQAEALLERKDLPAEKRDLYRIALRDSKNNLRALAKLMERRARAAEEAEKKKQEDETPADGQG
jgi:hypothetical protein